MMEKQTIVVKVGTSSLTLSDGTMDAEKIRNITTQLAALQTAGHHVILVSSGAIAAGFSRLGFKKRPTKIADKQAAAAVGQGLLMEEYTKNLMAYQIPCAQILLNRSDFEDRRRYKNIFGSLSVLLGRGAIPIINENDTIAIEELKVGDNDTLSAQVAAMLHASLLILLYEDGICASGGSACNTGEERVSYVIGALGVPDEYAPGTVRMTLSGETTREEIDRAVEALKQNLRKLRDEK